MRAYVRSDGNDLNAGAGCLLNNPCRTFATAHSVVDPGGEIVALDAAGYGAVTITKSVTITANPGYFAGISAASGNAVTIAAPLVEVILRGLNINSLGATYGIYMTDGSRLSVENCVISNFSTGVRVLTAARVRIIDTLIRDGSNGIYLSNSATGTIANSRLLDNSSIGIHVSGNIAGETTSAVVTDTTVTGGNTGVNTGATDPTGNGRMSLERVTLANNLYGVVMNSNDGTAVISIGHSQVTRNTSTGLYNQGVGTTLESLGNNNVRLNGANTSGVITTVPTI